MLTLNNISKRYGDDLVLDEPINHLDIPGRERFEAALATFGGTTLAAAHDRYFLAQFAERVLALRDGRLVDHPGDYADFVRDADHARHRDAVGSGEGSLIEQVSSCDWRDGYQGQAKDT
jgi:ATPase subunit of ABC transporter with duplicated ATPase domains